MTRQSTTQEAKGQETVSPLTIRHFTTALEGISPLSFSRHHDTAKTTAKETAAQWEERTWREKLHYNTKGEIFIPPMAFKNGIAEAARFLNLKIPGQKNATYTKHFERGVICDAPAMLGVHKDDVKSETLFLPSDGKRGGGSRVNKTFPVLAQWNATTIFQILDDLIDEDLFRRVLNEFGLFIGVGRFRPQNNGYYGRFIVKNIHVDVQPV
jgi:hypothetical protein